MAKTYNYIVDRNKVRIRSNSMHGFMMQLARYAKLEPEWDYTIDISCRLLYKMIKGETK